MLSLPPISSNFVIMLKIKDYFCPNVKCKHYGFRDMNNLVKAGTYTCKASGENRQMLKCSVCGQRFSETHSSLFAGSHYSDKTINSIMVCIADGNSIRATAKMLKLSKDRVNNIVVKAVIHAETMLSSLLHSIHLKDCQLDELWSFVNNTKKLTKKASKLHSKNLDDVAIIL